MTSSRSLRRLVEVAPDEPTVQRMWEVIDDRLEPRPRASRRRLVLGTLAIATVTTAIAMTLARPERRPDSSLTLADGSPVPREITADTRFVDGSEIQLADAHLRLLENDARQVTFFLREGRARFSIPPGGARRWIVETGPVRIEVVGTVFAVARHGGDLAVSVERGAVLVRGADVPDGVARLEAGDELRIAQPGRLASGGADPPDLPPPGSGPPPEASHRPGPAAAASRAKQPAPLSVAALLAEADQHRRRGEPEEAIRALARAAEVPGDPLAGLAWFTRARVLLELDRPHEAVDDLRRAIASGLPAALEERARARLAETLRRIEELAR